MPLHRLNIPYRVWLVLNMVRLFLPWILSLYSLSKIHGVLYKLRVNICWLNVLMKFKITLTFFMLVWLTCYWLMYLWPAKAQGFFMQFSWIIFSFVLWFLFNRQLLLFNFFLLVLVYYGSLFGSFPPLILLWKSYLTSLSPHPFMMITMMHCINLKKFLKNQCDIKL